MAEDNNEQLLLQSTQQQVQQSAQQTQQQQNHQAQQIQSSHLSMSQPQQIQASQLQQQQMTQSQQIQASQLQQQQMQASQLQQQQQMQQTQMQNQPHLQQQPQHQQPSHMQQQIQQSHLHQMQQQQNQLHQQQSSVSSSMSVTNNSEQSNQLNVSASLPSNVNPSATQQMATMQQNVNVSAASSAQMSASQLNSNSNAPVQMTVSHLSSPSGTPVQMTQLNTNSGQSVQMAVPQLNINAGTPVQMNVSQLTAQAQNVPTGTMMSQSSGPHPTMIHPTMTMAQAPIQQVQVIQQPLSTSYLQHLYPQQQMLFPGNLTLQHAGVAGPALQSLGTHQGLSLQLQAKPTLDSKTSGTATNLHAMNANKQGMNISAGSMMGTTGQMLSASTKTNFPQQMMATPGKSFLHNQSGFTSTNANQTVVIGQLGVLQNQQSIFNQKFLQDSQKGKAYAFQNQQAALQPKSLFSSLPVHSSAQVFNGSNMKQISSQPQIITSQASGNVINQAQLFGLQTLGASLPPGLSWATNGCLQSSALLAQNPIIIRSSQESNSMFIHSQPQAAMQLPVAGATTQPVPPTTYANAAAMPQKHKQVKARTGTQTVAVATQTIVSSTATVNSNTPPIRTQIKPKTPKLMSANLIQQTPPQMSSSETQTNQSPPQPAAESIPTPQSTLHQKSDAANQTNQVNDKKYLPVNSKSVSVAIDTRNQTPLMPQPKSQAIVAPSTKIIEKIMPSVDTSVSTTTPTVTSLSSTLSSSTVHVGATATANETVSSSALSVSIVSPMSQVKAAGPNNETSKSAAESMEGSEEVFMPLHADTIETSVEKDSLKLQDSMKKPSLNSAKDKQPQKAIVKPQVLTHVIEGFLIQEGPEPFPVRSSLFDSPCRSSTLERADGIDKRKESPTASSPEKKIKIHRGRGPGRRKKMGRGRKGFLKLPQIEENEMSTLQEQENSVSIPDDESSLSNRTEESSEIQEMSVISPSQKPPSKWSVQDVYEFIKDTPGCSDYAEVFRSQEIDGQALLLLKEDHLMVSMSMKLGPALKLLSQIKIIKGEMCPSDI